MKRRRRRVLFNLFAFSLLGIALYLNLFRMYEAGPLNKQAGVQAAVIMAKKNAAPLQPVAKTIHPD